MPQLPTYTTQQIANYLTTGYWQDIGFTGMAFNLGADHGLTVNLTGLTQEGRETARMALDAWTLTTGIQFFETNGPAEITFDDNQPGAFAFMSGSNGVAFSASVNVHTSWLSSGAGTPFATYGLQTYIHEIGHALGLGHAGNYNGNGGYAEDGSGDNHYLNDSWQMTVMSYFSQSENSASDANIAYVVTPQLADIQAIEDLYGAVMMHGGDTTWGVGSNLGYLDEMPDRAVAFTIHDDGGFDHFDASEETQDQTIDLRPGHFSSVWGRIDNMAITSDTVIEQATSGSGDDVITGNGARNVLSGGAGEDRISGGRLRDEIDGGDGDDVLFGEHGLDTLLGGYGNDELRGGVGNDVLKGQAGNDQLHGGSGRDLLLGGGGHDVLFGNFGNDTLNGYGGNDILRGGLGDDALSGGNGNDRLVGGQGDDLLNGGLGNDVFVFADFNGTDRIQDFADGDVISLASVSPIAGMSDLLNNHTEQVGGDVVIASNGTIIIENMQVADLTEEMFVF